MLAFKHRKAPNHRVINNSKRSTGVNI